MDFLNWTLEQAALQNMGPKRLQKLRNAGISTLRDLHEATAAQLARRTGISPNVFRDWQGQITTTLDQIAARQRDVETAPAPDFTG